MNHLKNTNVPGTLDCQVFGKYFERKGFKGLGGCYCGDPGYTAAGFLRCSPFLGAQAIEQFGCLT